MKKLLILLLYLSSVINSQWLSQTSPTTKTLRSIKAVNENVLWACGYSGVVIKTVNGGKTWNKTSYTDESYDNIAVQALDSNIAWVTGTKGLNIEAKIWKTTNGGTSWSEQWYNPLAYSNAMKFLDSANGVAFLDYGGPATEWIILTTSDGGEHWNQVPDDKIPDVDSLNNELGVESSLVTIGNNLWFVSYSAVDTRIYYSTDKGENWNKTEPLIPSATERSLYLVPISESKLEAFGGSGVIGFSEDGGVSWNFPILENLGLFVKSAVKIPGTLTLIAVGNFGRSKISNDLGQTWVTVPQTDERYRLRAVDAISQNDVWCVGDSGCIYKWKSDVTAVELNSFGEKKSANSSPSSHYIVNQNYPNPFNPATLIAYGLPYESNVKVSVYDALGQIVSELVNQVQEAGYYEVNWNAANASTGTYLYVIKAISLNGEKEFSSVKKMMLIK